MEVARRNTSKARHPSERNRSAVVDPLERWTSTDADRRPPVDGQDDSGHEPSLVGSEEERRIGRVPRRPHPAEQRHLKLALARTETGEALFSLRDSGPGVPDRARSAARRLVYDSTRPWM